MLKAVEKRYPGFDRVICATPLGTPLEVQLEDLDRFAKEVMPAFRDARSSQNLKQASGGGRFGVDRRFKRKDSAVKISKTSGTGRGQAALNGVSYRRV